MALEIKLNQKLSQTLVMTPQLQQAIKLLQLGRMEYLEVIEKELLENPVLEEITDSDEFNQQLTIVDGERNQSVGDLSETSLLPTDARNSTDESNNSNSEDYYDNFTDRFSESYSGKSKTDSDRDRPSIEAIANNSSGLVSHLLWQLRTTDLPESDQAIAEQIVGNLDRNGYLCCPIAEIAEICSCTIDEIERVLSVVQTLDPSGIAARDLKECLLLQLEQMGLLSTLPARIVANYLGELEIKRYDLIAKKENIDLEKVYSAIKIIQKLEPRPGRQFNDDSPIYITPDVFVRKVGEDYLVTLNESGIPKLRLNSVYQELLQNGRDKEVGDKEYLQDRVRSASWLIKSIHQRQQTILKVTQSIVKFQREFLDNGVGCLRPLVLRDVAIDVNMHESTVSRVTTNKYVHTPQGIYELKFFFTSGLKSDAGDVSSESVKNRIRDLIAKENQQKPLSDQVLVSMLKAEGIDVARRTVAKYREMMGILSSSRRKKMF